MPASQVLHSAITSRQIAMLSPLLEAGADALKTTDKGVNAVMLAVQQMSSKEVQHTPPFPVCKCGFV